MAGEGPAGGRKHAAEMEPAAGEASVVGRVAAAGKMTHIYKVRKRCIGSVAEIQEQVERVPLGSDGSTVHASSWGSIGLVQGFYPLASPRALQSLPYGPHIQGS